jgi:hypothetical protein
MNILYKQKNIIPYFHKCYNMCQKVPDLCSLIACLACLRKDNADCQNIYATSPFLEIS